MQPIGIVMLFFDDARTELATGSFKGQCHVSDLDKIGEICDVLEIPFYAVNAQRNFEANLLENYVSARLSGKFFPSCVVGLSIDESLVNAKEDESLYDNAKGFTNFAAPGADRLKITLTLSKKELSDKNDTNFVEIMRLDEGKVKVMQSKSDYNKIRDWIAKRRVYVVVDDFNV